VLNYACVSCNQPRIIMNESKPKLFTAKILLKQKLSGDYYEGLRIFPSDCFWGYNVCGNVGLGGS